MCIASTAKIRKETVRCKAGAGPVVLQPKQKHIGVCFRHEGDGKPFFAEVFQGCADEIDLIVKDQEAVMGFGKLFHFDGRVLGVVLIDIKLELRRYRFSTALIA